MNSDVESRGNIDPRIVSNKTLSVIVEEESRDYISGHPRLPDPKTCSDELYNRIVLAISVENSNRICGNKVKIITELPSLAIAMLIAARRDVALVMGGNRASRRKKIKNLSSEQKLKLPVGVYQESGDNEGVYEIATPQGNFGDLVEMYKPDATEKEKNEIFLLVRKRLKVVRKCVIPYYVAVGNGIYDVKNKMLMPFTPDLVFTAKIHTDLKLTATNPFIYIKEDGTTWDVESWLSDLGKQEFVDSILEVIQASCLPLAPRDKMCLFYSKVGNNGKGTICQLIRNILGEESTVSIPLSEFSSPFGLARLPEAVAIITDENDVSSYNKGLAALKAVITGDTVTINQKYQKAFDYKFNGLVLECINDLPNGDDKTGSFHRRLHIIPFENCFTGMQKRYIKSELIYREDVLEYVLKKVLVDMPYREAFTETDATRAALDEYVVGTNSVVDYLREILPQCQMNLLPGTDFLYEMYKEWYRKNTPSGKSIGRNDFLEAVRTYVNNNPEVSAEWEWTDCTRSAGYIDCSVAEPLIVEYNLTAFLADNLAPTSAFRVYPAKNKLKEKYSGLVRRAAVAAPGADNDDVTTD